LSWVQSIDELHNRPVWRVSSLIVGQNPRAAASISASSISNAVASSNRCSADFGSVVCVIDCPSLLLAFETARY